ncbi:MAG: DUF1015 domain-containing protein [Chloroflexi bacterium]|nr:DUF1015 domain-containing protein [Chloroflexota bacterium]
MVDVRPFRGLRYDQGQVSDLALVLCPPYDVISPQKQADLYNRSQVNMVRLEFGQELPQDSPIDNRYTRAAATLEGWLHNGILRTEDRAALYLHQHHFLYRGLPLRRQGLIACVRMEEWQKGMVRPHEATATRPKEDRMRLMRACHTNFSPIFALYDDPKMAVTSVLEECLRQPAVVDVDMGGGEGHRLWAVTEPQAIASIARALAPQQLYIADGHHRYETALAYSDEQRASQAWSADSAFNFTMMELVESRDPGLLVLAPHRVVRGIPQALVDSLPRRLEEFFVLHGTTLDQADSQRHLQALLRRMESEMPEESLMAVLGLKPGWLHVIKARQPSSWEHLLPPHRWAGYARLGVAVLQFVVLDRLLSTEDFRLEAGSNLDFVPDEIEALRRVRDGEYQMAFFLNPVRVECLKAIADAQDRLPKKATYFYPKLPSGLVINRLLGELPPIA